MSLDMLDDQLARDGLDASVTGKENRNLGEDCCRSVNGIRRAKGRGVSSQLCCREKHLSRDRQRFDELHHEPVVPLDSILSLEANRMNEYLGEGELTRDEYRLSLDVRQQCVSGWPPHLDAAATWRQCASDAATARQADGWDASECAPARRAGRPTVPAR